MQRKFKIAHLDWRAQGVSKEEFPILFIPKTLPGEEGEATIVNSKKQVQFGKITQLTKVSPERHTPKCPHYQECTGCHYLHADYNFELKQKGQQFQRMLQQCHYNKSIDIHPAPYRDSYRTRIQLHYDKEKQQLGLISDEKNIIPIPHCLLPTPHLKKKLHALYQNENFWKKLQDAPTQGHIELQQKDDQISLAINRPYAHQGFSQVFTKMNYQCQNIIETIYLDIHHQLNGQHPVVDLFGGDGNLSQNFNVSTLVVDSVTPHQLKSPHQQFLALNLYKANALKKLCKTVSSCDLLILDPPRSGLKNIADFTDKLQPTFILYLSCNPTTLIRDCKKLLANYKIEQAHLLDFFPSTYHWESLLFLQRG